MAHPCSYKSHITDEYVKLFQEILSNTTWKWFHITVVLTHFFSWIWGWTLQLQILPDECLMHFKLKCSENESSFSPTCFFPVFCLSYQQQHHANFLTTLESFMTPLLPHYLWIWLSSKDLQFCLRIRNYNFSFLSIISTISTVLEREWQLYPVPLALFLSFVICFLHSQSIIFECMFITLAFLL